MKKEKIYIFVLVSVVVLMFLVNFIFYTKLPNVVATHFNEKGIANGYSSKLTFLLTDSVLSVVLLGIFLIIPKVDPLKENIEKFKEYYYYFAVVIMIFMLLVHLQVILYNLGIKLDVNVFVSLLTAVILYFASLLVEKAKRNWFIGIRTPWTLSSDVVWDKTHRVGGMLLKVCSVLAILGAFFRDHAYLFILIPLLATTLYLVIFSYVEYQKEVQQAR